MGEGKTLGEKILRLRKELGISQHQVAGTEMSRSFLSLVERNICRPSAPLLKTIAQRLGKPVEYFLEAGTLPISLETTIYLVQQAEVALQKEDTASALGHATMALKLLEFLDEPELAGRAYWSTAKCRQRSGDWEGAMIAFEQYVGCCEPLKNKANSCKGYLELGRCAFHLEDFQGAERHYRRCITLSQGLKSLQNEFAQSLTYLGASLTRLGRLDEAREWYERALNDIDPKADSWLWAANAMSMGWVCSKLGRHADARKCTHQAHTIFVKLNHPDRVLAEHNIALMKRDAGEIEEALRELEACRDFYRKHGQTVTESSVTEDIAICHLRLGDLTWARIECEQAMKLLDFQDNALLRGRVYMTYAEIAGRQGEHVHARQLLEIAIGTFRRLRVTEELANALELNTRLTREMGASG
jgi:tetratricopeptide (TPR) repeat protein